jgi:hypothetical protein
MEKLNIIERDLNEEKIMEKKMEKLNIIERD